MNILESVDEALKTVNESLVRVRQRLHNPKLVKRDMRFLQQRVTRGWDDSETWSLDYSLAKLILPRLKRFKEVKNGCPSNLSQEEWDAILDKMIASFEFAASEERWTASNEEFEKHGEGLDLFAKHYFGLWW